jgi:hypothetical protein
MAGPDGLPRQKGFVPGLLVDVEADDVRALLGQSKGVAAALSPCRSGVEGDLALGALAIGRSPGGSRGAWPLLILAGQFLEAKSLARGVELVGEQGGSG